MTIYTMSSELWLELRSAWIQTGLVKMRYDKRFHWFISAHMRGEPNPAPQACTDESVNVCDRASGTALGVKTMDRI